MLVHPDEQKGGSALRPPGDIQAGGSGKGAVVVFPIGDREAAKAGEQADLGRMEHARTPVRSKGLTALVHGVLHDSLVAANKVVDAVEEGHPTDRGGGGSGGQVLDLVDLASVNQVG